MNCVKHMIFLGALYAALVGAAHGEDFHPQFDRLVYEINKSEIGLEKQEALLAMAEAAWFQCARNNSLCEVEFSNIEQLITHLSGEDSPFLASELVLHESAFINYTSLSADTTRPTIESASINPDVLDMDSGGTQFTIEYSVRDDQSGIRWVQFQLSKLGSPSISPTPAGRSYSGEAAVSDSFIFRG